MIISIAIACMHLGAAIQGGVSNLALNNRGGITFSSMGEQFSCRVRVSAPGGKWSDSQTGRVGNAVRSTNDEGVVNGNAVTFKTPEVSVTRTVSVAGTHLEVSDVYTNQTDRLVGVIVQNTVQAGSQPQNIYLCGNDVSDKGDRQTYDPGNPSVYCSYPSGGLGIVEVSDVMRAQGKVGYYSASGMSFLDDCLGIAPGGSQTLEWSIYPTPSGSFWAFINEVRRDWNVNYTVTGPFSFEPGGWETSEKKGPQDPSVYTQWAQNLGLKYIANVITHTDEGQIADGTGLPLAVNGLAATKSWMGKIQSNSSGVIPLLYFHAQANSEPGAVQKYSDSVKLDKNGQAIAYPSNALYTKQVLPLLLPTLDDSYGTALLGTIDQLLHAPEVGGLYWDEMSGSYPETSPAVAGVVNSPVWDNATVKIDLTSHEVTNKEACVPLAIQPFEKQAVGMIGNAGKALLANSEAYTKTMMDLHILRFVEGGNKNIAACQLGCPLVLSNMRLDKTPDQAIADAVAILNQGGIFYAWRELWTPEPTDFYRLMFPITPVDVRPGVIVGRERIICSKSGTYAFGNGQPATIYVFDSNARLRNDLVAAAGSNAANYHYQVKVPAGGLAILVKQ